ncbi:MAG: uroporphyrinogen-III synthase [Rhodospirillales bacterium]
MADAILITRPEPGAGDTAFRVAALGFEPLLAPVFTIEPVPARLPSAVAAVLATSGNALAPCFPACRLLPLYTVGDATAARARAMGFGRVVSASGDAVALAALAIRDLRPADGTLLLASGRGQGMPLATTLRQAGFRVLRRAVYRAVPSRALPDAAVDALRAGTVRAALFFSAATARTFVRLIQNACLGETVRSVEALAIGAAAGVALQGLPWRRVGVAAKPTQDAMLALLR